MKKTPPIKESLPLHAAVCNWVAVTFLKAPPNVPKAVLLAPTMKIPATRSQIIFKIKQFQMITSRAKFICKDFVNKVNIIFGLWTFGIFLEIQRDY